ncbi:putative Hemerythrin-like metal-binding domain-containing protein [Candidatus Terasakiella magnetica]|uniref:Putative Hemerythrin-like metal-binding domain-containing protein n=1 Tax=Candidatus Terasakiella magnetica TaxID=1867952 RepID=A0A1C3RFV2_9PROT|nr:bacteriohemerythrin [Candidatus Terasakiella magnetica]SCA56135.1 putative Hemerythrin-like metal-binding domain-containing protein [Candidatus Terasakiella magnetica]
MIEISWAYKKHSVGNDKLDEQHKMLLNLINQLFVQSSVLVNPEHDKGYGFILDALMKYVDGHLAYEESLLEQIGYADLDNHKIAHQKFLDKVQSLSLESADEGLKKDLVHFLMNWWENHIMTEDMKYKPFVEALSN